MLMDTVHEFKSFSSLKDNWDNYNNSSYRFISRAVEILEPLEQQPEVIRLSEYVALDYLSKSSFINTEDKKIKLEIEYRDDKYKALYFILKINNDRIVHCFETEFYCISEYYFKLDKIDKAVKRFYMRTGGI